MCLRSKRFLLKPEVFRTRDRCSICGVYRMTTSSVKQIRFDYADR